MSRDAPAEAERGMSRLRTACQEISAVLVPSTDARVWAERPGTRASPEGSKADSDGPFAMPELSPLAPSPAPAPPSVPSAPLDDAQSKPVRRLVALLQAAVAVEPSGQATEESTAQIVFEVSSGRPKNGKRDYLIGWELVELKDDGSPCSNARIVEDIDSDSTHLVREDGVKSVRVRFVFFKPSKGDEPARPIARTPELRQEIEIGNKYKVRLNLKPEHEETINKTIYEYDRSDGRGP